MNQKWKNMKPGKYETKSTKLIMKNMKQKKESVIRKIQDRKVLHVKQTKTRRKEHNKP